MTSSSLSSSSSSTISDQQIPKWHIKADYVEACNCDYGCPCNFSGFPTGGSAETLVLYHIQLGNYGDVKVDGLDVVIAYSWPKAIHEGNGTFQHCSLHRRQEKEIKEKHVLVYFLVRPKEKVHLHYLLTL